jgi:hypothetical protein
MPHFQASRPRYGYCYLDFLDRWLWDAVFQYRDPDKAYRYGRELAHWALLMHPYLAYRPHNVVLGEN